MKTTLIITAKQLQSVLENTKYCKFASILTYTDVRMKKTNNPLACEEVKKASIKQVQFNYNYQTAVNNRLAKAGLAPNFEALSLPWGEWVVPNKTISHKGEIYGRFYVLPKGKVANTYFVNGRQATADEVETIKSFEYSHNSARQEESGLTEEQEVKPWTINLKNVRKIKIDHITYEIVG